MEEIVKNILNIKDLSFIVDKPILSKINWIVQKKERWALLGANGAGKTSLLSTICAYNTPSEGSMELAGRTYSECDWQEVRKHIAIVSAHLNRQILPTETAFETVVSGAYAMLNFWGKPSDEVLIRAMKKMKELKIWHLCDRPWGKISQGERQKVLIARSLMIKPAIMFLDEPCAGLDPLAREKFIEFLDLLASKKSTPAIVLATHHVEEIPQSFTHAIVLKEGKVSAQGEISKIIKTSILSDAYGAKCTVRKKAGKFALKVSRAF